MLRHAVRVAVFALALGSAAPSFAVPLTDLRAEDLLAMAPDVKKSLDLNANQQTLWQQVEARTRAVLRERQLRRERMHQQTKTMLEKPGVELRDLNALIDAEAGLSAAEDKQLRELWLTVNDALDDKQRATVAGLLSERMARVANPVMQHGGEQRGRGDGGSRRGGGGMGHGRGGGMGMPGS
jgi:hypothetical protein